jgi:hypothetical protein
MTVDPLFTFNPSLQPISNVHTPEQPNQKVDEGRPDGGDGAAYQTEWRWPCVHRAPQTLKRKCMTSPSRTT